MRRSTVTGYEVSKGAVVERKLFATRAEAAKHVVAKDPGERGWCVRWGKVVEVVTTKRQNGRLRHQEVTGNGYYWDDYTPHHATRLLAEKERVKYATQLVSHRKRELASARAELRGAERELAKAGRKIARMK